MDIQYSILNVGDDSGWNKPWVGVATVSSNLTYHPQHLVYYCLLLGAVRSGHTMGENPKRSSNQAYDCAQ